MLFDTASRKATIILLILQDTFDDAAFAPVTYCSGREVGYKLQSRTNNMDDMNGYVVVVENSKSDAIKVMNGDWKSFDFPSGVANDKARVKYFDYNSYVGAANYVQELLTNPAK